MTIDEQLRDIARRAEQLQPVITAHEVVQRAGTHGTAFTTPSRVNGDRTINGYRPVQSDEGYPNMIDLEIPSQTDEHRKGSKRVVVAGLLAAAAVIAFVLVAIRNDEPTTPAEQPSTTVPETSPPPTMSDLEVIEAGAAAFYSGDAEKAAELFELPDRTDDQIRAESAYQAAIGGRVSLTCTENAPASFNCSTPYRNAMTDAIRQGGGDDVSPVRVEDGVITQFVFTEHTSLLLEMGILLASEGRFDGYEDCIEGPFPESCASIQIENLDAWVAWRQTLEPADKVEAVVGAWYQGDCEAAVLLSWGEPDCSASSVQAPTVAYESILGAQVSFQNCETTQSGDHTNLSCDVQYSNVMHDAVGKSPAVTTREFVLMFGIMPSGPDEQPWYDGEYPEDTELRDSFRLFAEGGELADEYAAAGCASTRSSECANLIVDNLDAWATWYQTNG